MIMQSEEFCDNNVAVNDSLRHRFMIACDFGRYETCSDNIFIKLSLLSYIYREFVVLLIILSVGDSVNEIRFDKLAFCIVKFEI